MQARELETVAEERRLELVVDAAAGRGQIGYQIFDADTQGWVAEGEWVSAGEGVRLAVRFPEEPGRYRAFVSTRDEERGWDYERGDRFLVIDAHVDEQQRLAVESSAWRTRRGLAWRSLPSRLAKVVTSPFATLFGNWRLIASLVRRDLLARYRGSFGDVLWTILNPLLLMATYYFVFAVVLRTRFPGDATREGFVLYFLAGMLPWLAMSEPLTRSTVTLHENRNLIKKLVFPVEILPAVVTLGGLVTGLFAMGIFVAALLGTPGTIPASAAWFPLVLTIQWLFTVGLAWMFAALGAYVRDLGHIIGYLLTLWFFVTPICYPETQLPEESLVILGKNPLWTVVRTYRLIFLEGKSPEWIAFGKLAAVGLVFFFAGHAVFYRLRRRFADII